MCHACLLGEVLVSCPTTKLTLAFHKPEVINSWFRSIQFVFTDRLVYLHGYFRCIKSCAWVTLLENRQVRFLSVFMVKWNVLSSYTSRRSLKFTPSVMCARHQLCIRFANNYMFGLICGYLIWLDTVQRCHAFCRVNNKHYINKLMIQYSLCIVG